MNLLCVAIMGSRAQWDGIPAVSPSCGLVSVDCWIFVTELDFSAKGSNSGHIMLVMELQVSLSTVMVVFAIDALPRITPTFSGC